MAYRLFRHRPTARWVPIIQDARERTRGESYLPDLARQYGLNAADIAVLVQDDRPADFETNRVPQPTPVAPSLPVERDPVFRATVLTLLDLINVERVANGRAAIAPPQFIAAVKAKL